MAAASAAAVAFQGRAIPQFPAAPAAVSKPSPILVLSALPSLPRRSSRSSIVLPEARKFLSLRFRASSEETSSPGQADDLLKDLHQKWDKVENKSTVLIYGGGAIVAVWLSSIVVGAINSVPLLPKIMELVGLGYTGWFVYRYLLFKSSRKELACDIEELKKKIAGTTE